MGGGDIQLIAFITEPRAIRKILKVLGEPLEPPPGVPARGPPTYQSSLVALDSCVCGPPLLVLASNEKASQITGLRHDFRATDFVSHWEWART